MEQIKTRVYEQNRNRKMTIGIGVIGDIQSSRGRHALITNIFISPAGEYNTGR